MTEIVTVHHPVPIRHVPGSREKLSLVGARTPARIVELGASEMPEAGHVMAPAAYGGHRRHPLHLHAGSLWLPLRHDSGRPFDRNRLRAYLEGSDEHDRGGLNDVMHALARTPVLASRGVGWTRGETIHPRRMGRVLRDGTERARSDLTRFLAEEVRLAGGLAYARLPGPLARWTYDTGRATFRLNLSPRLTGSGPDEAGLATRLDEAWGFMRTVRGHCASIAEEPRLVDASLPDGLVEADDDITLAANSIPYSLLGQLEAFLKYRTPDGTDVTLVRDRAWVLQEPSDRGEAGGVQAEEAQGVLAAVSDLCAAVIATYPADTPGMGSFRTALSYVETVALPRLRGRDPAAEADDEALSGLGP